MKIKWKRAVSIILVMTLMVTFAQWKVYADEEKETTEIVEIIWKLYIRRKNIR